MFYIYSLTSKNLMLVLNRVKMISCLSLMEMKSEGKLLFMKNYSLCGNIIFQSSKKCKHKYHCIQNNTMDISFIAIEPGSMGFSAGFQGFPGFSDEEICLCVTQSI